MDVGVLYANLGGLSEPEGAARMARTAEDAGFESVWTIEHVVVPAGYETEYPYSETGRMPMADDESLPEPLTWLAYIAAITTTLRLCTGGIILPQRNPFVLAKVLSTLDSLSGGRVTLGIGAGWMREEFEVLGVPFEGRGRRMDEAVEVMRALWEQPKASFAGEFYEFSDIICRPRPAQASIPIVIGGHSEAAARRAGRLGDGLFPAKGNLSALFELAKRTAEENGRDPDALEFTTGIGPNQHDDIDVVRRLADRGVHRVLIPADGTDVDGTIARMQRFQERVISKLN